MLPGPASSAILGTTEFPHFKLAVLATFLLVLSEGVLVLDNRMIAGMRFEYEYRRKRLSTNTMVASPEQHNLPKFMLECSLQQTG